MKRVCVLAACIALAAACGGSDNSESANLAREAPDPELALPAPDPTIGLLELGIERADMPAVLMGQVDPATNADFVAIPSEYASRNGMYGRADAVDAFGRMYAAAKADGVNLKIISAFRSFADQKRIWEDKWAGRTKVEGGRLPDTVPQPEARALKILEFSSMPGTSRHHWGTDFDLNDLNNAWFDRREGRTIHDWLTAHAWEYGFCQAYTEKGPSRPTGYELEKWHWSYAPAASKFLAAYPAVVGDHPLSGFEGAETAKAINVVANYVEGVSSSCKL